MKPKDNNNSKRNMSMRRDYENILYRVKLRGERIAREEGYSESYAEAFGEGYAEAFAEGYAKGFAKGYVEGCEKERKRIASELLSLGVSEQIICRVSRLSPEEVRML